MALYLAQVLSHTVKETPSFCKETTLRVSPPKSLSLQRKATLCSLGLVSHIHSASENEEGEVLAPHFGSKLYCVAQGSLSIRVRVQRALSLLRRTRCHLATQLPICEVGQSILRITAVSVFFWKHTTSCQRRLLLSWAYLFAMNLAMCAPMPVYWVPSCSLLT